MEIGRLPTRQVLSNILAPTRSHTYLKLNVGVPGWPSRVEFAEITLRTCPSRRHSTVHGHR
jgi:hypothetical protein